MPRAMVKSKSEVLLLECFVYNALQGSRRSMQPEIGGAVIGSHAAPRLLTTGGLSDASDRLLPQAADSFRPASFPKL
jgi:hypothetical protein